MPSSRPTILLVDDEPLSLDTLTRTLDEACEGRTATNTADAIRILEEDWIQAVISDQRMPEETGVEFLARVRARWPEVARMIVSGYTEAGHIIEGVNRAGILQYITKPWHPEDLLLIVGNACRRSCCSARTPARPGDEGGRGEPRAASRQDPPTPQTRFRLDRIVRRRAARSSAVARTSPGLRRRHPGPLYRRVRDRQGAGRPRPALQQPPRRQALRRRQLRRAPRQLLESELFGHEKGAFTGAVTARVGSSSWPTAAPSSSTRSANIAGLQVKLLRVLQEREVRARGRRTSPSVNVRVVAATNRDLERRDARGPFRDDLYYRIAGIRLHLPPLRERSRDIRLARRAFVARRRLAPSASAAHPSGRRRRLPSAYAWPGNVRELQNEIHRLVVVSDAEVIVADLLAPQILRGSWRPTPGRWRIARRRPGAGAPHPGLGTLKERVEAMEAEALRETLIRYRGPTAPRGGGVGTLACWAHRAKIERYGCRSKTPCNVAKVSSRAGGGGTRMMRRHGSGLDGSGLVRPVLPFGEKLWCKDRVSRHGCRAARASMGTHFVACGVPIEP